MKMKKGKRVLLFIDSMGAGGAQRQMAYLACLLMRRGYVVKLITYGDNSFYAPMLKSGGVLTEEIDGADSYIKRIPKVKIAIDEFNPDCVISFLDTPCMITSLIKAVYRKEWRLVVSERNTTQKMTLRERIKFYLYKYADAIVPNSHSQEEFIIKQYPYFIKKTRTIVNLVDLEKFHPVKKTLDSNQLQIMVAATLWPPKNALGLIRAIREVVNKGFVNFQVKWYGHSGSEYEIECKKLIKELGLNDYVKLLPKSQNIVEKYQEADWFCLPSFYEGTPNVICEAMACGLPVICSDVCDNHYYVKPGENGFLFDPNSVENIADIIIKALDVSKDKMGEMGDKSRTIAEKRLSAERFIDEYCSVIDAL